MRFSFGRQVFLIEMQSARKNGQGGGLTTLYNIHYELVASFLFRRIFTIQYATFSFVASFLFGAQSKRLAGACVLL